MTRLPDPERSSAFLFGTASYESDDLPDLPAVANNLEGLRAALSSPLGAFAAERCNVLLDPAGSIPVHDALRHHAAEAADTLLIYFAGHGLRKLRGGLYLALPYTHSANAVVSGFDYDVLREIVHASRATNKIVIVDSCFSGRAIQGMSGLTQELDIDGSCLLTATTANEQALAPPGQTYTTFTGELLHLLRHGIPEAGPLLSLGTMGEELRRSARRRGLPVPEQQFRGTTHHIALTRNPAAPTADAPPPPTVPPPPRPTAQNAYVSRALVFAGTSHATKKDLAETIRAHWSTAADRYFRRMGTEAHPTESWGELRSWLRQFNNPLTDDVEGRAVLIDRYLTETGLPPDLKLLRLLHWLDPEGPVVHRGRLITYATLARACLRRYSDGGRDDADLLSELSEQDHLLDTLAEFPTLHELRGVRRRWTRALRTWQTHVSQLWPAEVRAWADEVGPGALLAAMLPPEHLEGLGPRSQTGETRPPDPSTWWYDRLLKAAKGRDTLLGRLVEAEWSERAQEEGLAEAEMRELRRRADEARRERQLRQEQEATEQRLAEVRRKWEQEQRAEEEERQRRHREAEAAQQQRQRELVWRAVVAARTRPASRVLAVLRALGLALAWALPPLALIWLTWWLSGYGSGATEFLSLQTAAASGSTLITLVPCAARLGAAFRPRLRASWTWLPWSRGTPATGALLLVYGLLSSDMFRPSDGLRAGSDLLLGPVVAAGCCIAGLLVGRSVANRWEAHDARIQQETYRRTRLP